MNLRDAFAKLADLLEQSGDKALADFIRWETRTDEACARFACSLELWGGAGSVADQAGIDAQTGESRRFRAEIEHTLVGIATEQQRVGLKYPRATSWAQTFQKWAESGSPNPEN